MTIWLDGQFTDDARISVLDRGFTLGDGVFDTILAVDGVLDMPAAHFERLARHAKIMDIPVPASAVRLDEIAVELLARTQLDKGRAAIRTTLTRGTGARGLIPPEKPLPSLVMTAAPAPDPVSLPPLSVIVSRAIRRNEGSVMSYIKSLNYGDHILALQEARAAGAGDAILLNNKGMACCTSAGNIFVRIGGAMYTPPIRDGVMDGVTRARLLAQGIAEERSIDQAMLERCEALFITNSLLGVRSVAMLDQRPLDTAFTLRDS